MTNDLNMEKIKDLKVPLYMKKVTEMGRVHDIVSEEELVISKKYQTCYYHIFNSYKPIS